MSETADQTSQAEETANSGSIEKAANRGLRGMFSGLQTGGIIAAGLTGLFLAVDATFGTTFAHDLVFAHAATPVAGVAAFAGVHCVGAAAFEGACEAYDGYKGIEGERDHIQDTARSVDKELLKLEGEPSPAIAKAQAYQFDNPQPKTSPVIQALIAQGASIQDAEQWRDRLAAQQLAQMTQDRTV